MSAVAKLERLMRARPAELRAAASATSSAAWCSEPSCGWRRARRSLPSRTAAPSVSFSGSTGCVEGLRSRLVGSGGGDAPRKGLHSHLDSLLEVYKCACRCFRVTEATAARLRELRMLLLTDFKCVTLVQIILECWCRCIEVTDNGVKAAAAGLRQLRERRSGSCTLFSNARMPIKASTCSQVHRGD